MIRPYCVGLTGGIGSGKSTVAELFAERGVAIVDTDRIAHDLTGPMGKAMPAITEAFGVAIVAVDGSLDRVRMRARVFEDAGTRQRLESILHPLIHEVAMELVQRARAPYVLLVVPLLIETTGYRDSVDRILVVDCTEADQVARVSRRGGQTPDEVRAIIAAQASRAERLRAADDVINNGASPGALAAQVAKLHQQYLAYAAAGC
jgi:dephospho-CoA kinase